MQFIEQNLSERTQLAKQDFFKKIKLAKNNKEKWVKNIAEVARTYLKDVYNISVPCNFSQQLYSAHAVYHTYTQNINLPLTTLDSIVQACEMWLEYLDYSKENFDNLVCQEILRMVEIHTSVIAARNIATVQGITLKKEAPYLMVTIVTMDGSIKVYS